MGLLRRKQPPPPESKFRAEVYLHKVRGEDRWDFRIVRRQNGKVVATSGRQGYSRTVDAVATLLELGIPADQIRKVTL